MDELVRGAEKLGITLTANQQEQFATFLHELKAYNEHTNLTAIRDDAGIIHKHFLDSLSVIQAIPESSTTLIDIGTGAGFPGLPIAIVRPNLSLTLVESVGKKTTFISQMVQKLGLQNVTVINARAEDVIKEKDFREHFDIATARAVAELRVLLEYTLPFVKVGGKLIAQKTAGAIESDAAKHALKVLGGTLKESIAVGTDRQLIVIEKTNRTPSEYPRRSGTATKDPL